MTANEESRYQTLLQLAAVLHVSRLSPQRWIRAGDGPAPISPLALEHWRRLVSRPDVRAALEADAPAP